MTPTPALQEIALFSQTLRASPPGTLFASFEKAAQAALSQEELTQARQSALWRGGLAICALCDQRAQTDAKSAPAYHNRLHFAEATYAMARLCSVELRASPWQTRLLALAIMAGHDALHDGTQNDPAQGKNLELISAQATDQALAQAGVSQRERALCFDAIEGTDPLLARANAERYGSLNELSAPDERERAVFRALANDADTLISLLPETGFDRGEELATEWSSFNPRASRSARSFKGRCSFLLFCKPITQAAIQIGLEDCRLAQLRAFASFDPQGNPADLDAAASRGALALDAQEPQAAALLLRQALDTEERETALRLVKASLAWRSETGQGPSSRPHLAP